MAFSVKFKNVSSVKSFDIGEPDVWSATLNTTSRAPECELKNPSWVANTHTFSCTGGIL